MEIYDHGRVVIKPPFQIEDKVYTLSSNSTITALMDMGIDIYTKVYQPAGYTVNQFKRVLLEEPIISVLRTDSGDIRYVPKDFLMSSDEGYVPYHEMGVLLNLGPLKDFDFKILKDSLIKTVQNRLGTNPAISLETISDTLPVTLEEDKLLDEQRNKVISGSNSLEAQLIKAQDHNIILKAQVRALLEFIQYYLKSCCGKSICFNDGQGLYKVYYRHEINWYVMVEHTHGTFGDSGNSGNFTGETNAFESYLRRWEPRAIV